MRFPGFVRSAVGTLLMAVLGACAPLSVEDERSLGADFSRNFELRTELVRDATVARYISAIGARLLEHAAPQPFSYRFKVVPNDDVNAFAAPAGHIYLYTGTILAARNVSELAAVIAHEIGHVAKRHVARNFNRALATNILRQAGAAAAQIAAGAEAGRATAALGGLAAMGYLNTFSREAEHEADVFALGLMHRAGYDPRGLVSFFETLQKEKGGGSAPSFLSTHPATAVRIANARKLIEGLPPGVRLEAEDEGRLRQIQRILRQGARKPRRHS
ncbi:MAG: M48 family metallopeptidase [Deltaproteobacteria bacterium]|nr:M48 family metallopeptidase [Deltaproteobacteria bacterium]